MTLAAHLGGMTVEEMLDRISAVELAEWEAQYKLSPFGDEWKQTVRICGVVAMAMGLKKKDGTCFQESDFYPIAVRQLGVKESEESISAKLVSLVESTKHQKKKKKK